MRRSLLLPAVLCTCTAPVGAQSGLDDGAAPLPQRNPEQIDPRTKQSITAPAFNINAERQRRLRKVLSAIVNTINGTDGDDFIFGTPGNDAIDAMRGNDTVEALGGDDLVMTGPGFDTADGGPGCDVLIGGTEINFLYGGSEDDCIEGGPGINAMFGEEGNDVITGGASVDLIEGGIGADMGQGGPECDLVRHDVFANRGWADMFDGQGHVDELCLLVSEFWLNKIQTETTLIQDYEAFDHDNWFDFSPYGGLPALDIKFFLTVRSLEMLTFELVPPPALFTSLGDDVSFAPFVVSQWDPASYYDAMEGNDAVVLPGIGEGPADYDESNAFTGGPGEDFIFGGTRNDIIFGGLGSDRIRGDEGNDILDGDPLPGPCGGVDQDRVEYLDPDLCNYAYAFIDERTIQITDLTSQNGEEGTDTVANFEAMLVPGAVYNLRFSDSDDQFGIAQEADFILAFNDAGSLTTIAGFSAGIFVDWILSDDVLFGGDGPNIIAGDVLTSMGAPAAQGITEGGNDLIKGGDGNDDLFGDAGDRFVNVAAGGNDKILGGPGNDSIWGDAKTFDADNASGGNDELRGEEGDDVVIGDFEDIASGVGTVILGNDTVVGGPGNDCLYGDFINDNTGGAIGNADGEDLLIPGPGNDVCYGGIAQIGIGAPDTAQFPRPHCDYEYVLVDGQSLDVLDPIDETGGINRLVRVDLVQNNNGTYAVRLFGSTSAPPGTGDPNVDELIVGDNAARTLRGDGLGNVTGASLSHDIIAGGSMDDTIYGDVSGTLENGTTGGSDCIQGNGGADTLIGDAFRLESLSRGRSDHIQGGDGADEIIGDAFVVLDSTCGQDLLEGDDGNDTIIGDADQFDALSVAGADRIFGGPGNDSLYGDEGPAGNAIVFGAEDSFFFELGEGPFGSDTIFKLGDGGVADEIVIGGVPRADPAMATLADLDQLVTEGDAFISEFSGSVFISIDSRVDGVGGNGTDSGIELDGVTGIVTGGPFNFTQLDAALRAANLASIDAR